MAWQSPNMGNGGPQGGGETQGPVGTEYTLQGVMRFLQLEWHNHERARNAWDIERAEMKAKIAKQEGEVRSAKRLNEQLEKHIKMLEHALKNERAKAKGGAAAEKPSAEQEKADVKGKGSLSPESKRKTLNKQHNSFLDIEPEAQDQTEAEREAQRDKSRLFLTKCVEEISYLLQPPSHPPPSQTQLQSLASSTGFLNQSDGSLPMEELYLQQQRQKQQDGMGIPPQPAIPNHHPPPIPSLAPDVPNLASTSQMPQQAAFMSREPSNPQVLSQAPITETAESQAQAADAGFPSLSEEEVEKVTHSYDTYGRPMSGREGDAAGARTAITEDPNGWNFDETTPALEPPPELPPPRRPDTDAFPSANSIPAKSPPRSGAQSHRRKSSSSGTTSRRRSSGHEAEAAAAAAAKLDPQQFKVRFALRGHLDVVRSVIFTGGGSPSEPEICTAGDDGMIKRWIIPASYVGGQHAMGNDLDIQSYFTHRGHEGVVTCLAPSNASFSTGGRVTGDGWIFSGGQDATVRVWERGRVDPKATLVGHTDAVWAVCVLPTTCGQLFGSESTKYGGPDRVLLASGSADGTVKIWAVSAPPQLASPSTGSRRGVGGSRRHSVTSGSNFPSSPQPSVATATPFHYTLVHSIKKPGEHSPTCITPLSKTGETIVVSYTDSSILIFDTRTGNEIIGMASGETYDGTRKTGINTVVASPSIEGTATGAPGEEEGSLHGATGTTGGVEGVVVSGHEDRFIRFFDANSGQCTYSMLAHPAAISSLHLSPDGREAVSAGHDASIRFWSLEKRICTQEISSHRIMRGEGVCSVVWSQDGRLVVSAGGDGVIKVFVRA